ncbi:MAG TPA: SPW repeat protein [Usitatibacter sp.]|nr:SPW repeat protein [Usitatibacter sp.]
MKGCPWHDRLVLLAGIWLFISPFALGVPSLSHPAVVAAYVAGAALVSSAAEAPAVPDLVEEWIALTVGAGLAATPWLLGYAQEPGATANAVVIGALVSMCALLGLLHRARMRHADEHTAQIGS